ncbi:MAG: hypothetical protein GDA56_09685 [Hormoscilla sp. GM7CHS1pb]|nr:hypothetical protein [Hormoscilla sp. GM7CHS1pb]
MWRKLKKKIEQWRGVFLIGTGVAGVTIAGSITGVFGVLEWGIRDQFFSLRTTEPVDERIAIVTIDESDITKVGLRGTIPPELGNLGNLRHLWLDHNSLGVQFPLS